MNASFFRSLSILGIAALCFGCGGPQANVVPVSVAAEEHTYADPVLSGELLYTIGFKSGSSGSYVRVYSFPHGHLVQEFPLNGNAYATAICADGSGNVFFPALTNGSQQSEVLEYAHGGTAPIATLSDSPYPTVYGLSCSIDAITGNLAVSNSTGGYYSTNIAVYTGAKGTPTFYSYKEFLDSDELYCAYDGQGNLFVDGFLPGQLAELPSGGSSFQILSVKRKRDAEPINNMLWDGTHLTFYTYPAIYQLAFDGSGATIVGKTGMHWSLSSGYTIQSGTAVSVYKRFKTVGIGFWHYPAEQGGPNEPYKTLADSKSAGNGIGSFAVSASPSAGRRKQEQEP